MKTRTRKRVLKEPEQTVITLDLPAAPPPAQKIKRSFWSGKPQAPTPNAIVWDLKTREFGPEYIEAVPQNAIKYPRAKDGKPFYDLIRHYKADGTTELKAYKRPDKIDLSPEDLYERLMWDAEAKELFGNPSDLWPKIKIGMLAVVALMTLLAIFLMSGSSK